MRLPVVLGAVVVQGLAPTPMLLSDVPSPALVLELGIFEANLAALGHHRMTMETALAALSEAEQRSALDGCTFIHSSVRSTEERDASDALLGSGQAEILAEIDAGLDAVGPGGCYLCLGLNNHHVMGYYWARSAGAGASMEAPGIGWRAREGGHCGELFRLTDMNTNDGKRSEWCDFLQRGDQIQLVPLDPYGALNLRREITGSESASLTASYRRVFGVRREGRPRGAEPAVECAVDLLSGSSAVV